MITNAYSCTPQIKSVPNASGQTNFIATPSSSNGPTFVSKNAMEEYVQAVDASFNPEPSPPKPKKKSVVLPDVQLTCDTCEDIGTSANTVR